MSNNQNQAIDLLKKKFKKNFKQKYLKILPPDNKLYYNQSGSLFSIYIAPYYIKLDEMEKNLDKINGFISFAITPDELIVQYMQSNNCGKGIGHYLLLVAAEIAHSENKETLSLDDDSDKARTPASIYLKAGLNYVEGCSNEPEMVCKPFEMLDKYETFVKNYVIPGEFFKNAVTNIDDAINTVKFNKMKKTQTRGISKR